MLSIVRSNLLPNALSIYIKKFSKHIEENCQKIEGFPTDPYNYSSIPILATFRKITFSATLKCIFGEIFEKFEEGIEEAFVKFDGGFELASSNVPHVFQRNFVNSKEKLLSCTSSVLQSYVDQLKNDQLNGKIDEKREKSIGEVMTDLLGVEGTSNWLLAIMWASEANSIPSLFWLFHYFLSNVEYYEKTKEEIDSLLNHQKISEISDFSELQKFSLLKMAIQETFRLHSPPIILRGVRKDFQLKDYLIPEGNFLCLSPFWAHRDPSVYDHPDVWDPYRWDRSSSSHLHEQIPYLIYRLEVENIVVPANLSLIC